MEFKIKETKYNFFLDISGDIFSIIGFLIYLEIFILNCCGLNYDSRKNIDFRSRMDSLLGMSSVDMTDMNDSMIEEDDDDISRKATNKTNKSSQVINDNENINFRIVYYYFLNIN